MKQYGLIGNPLGHSFSADFFTRLFEREQISAYYTPYELASIEELAPLLQRESNLIGLNITSPYKEVALAYATTLSPEVATIRAANVLHIHRNPMGLITDISAHNTDIIGFRRSLEPLIPEHNISCALILGTGGASQAVAYALSDLGIGYIYISRIQRDSHTFGYEHIEEYLPRVQLIIQATPVGLHSAEVVAFPYHRLTNEHLCYDLIYNPSETAFLARSKKYGAKTKNGLEMLHLQAQAAWDIWQHSQGND